MASIQVGSRAIGDGHRVFVIAEAGVNHNGDMALAKRLIDAAVEAGADSVKFQTFKAEESVTAEAPLAAYQKKNDKTAKSFLGMLQKLELAPENFKELADYAREKGILFFSKPAYPGAVEILEAAGVPLYKIGSGDINFFTLLRQVAATGKPVIISTGMSTLDEIREALEALKEGGCSQAAVLHCVTAYPVEFRFANLKAIETLRRHFSVPIGYSDHTVGVEAAVAAVAMGACIIEKHLTLDRALPGPDHLASLEPGEFKTMVEQIRHVEESLGTGEKGIAECERENARLVRKSLVAARPIRKGDVILEAMIAYKRPGTGLSDKHRSHFVGKPALREIRQDEPLQLDMV
ncbi:MAG: N-acetylneuraminate synthase [Elusimicrobia bacterium]|nr:N-acetylneuraminate synthase [Elusimicrobiota bacterium]